MRHDELRFTYHISCNGTFTSSKTQDYQALFIDQHCKCWTIGPLLSQKLISIIIIVQCYSTENLGIARSRKIDPPAVSNNGTNVGP